MSALLPVELRPGNAADAAAMAGLHRGSAAEIWDEPAFAALLAGPGVFALLAEAEGGLVALILARAVADEAEILTLAVDPVWRRRGIGSALLEAAAGIAAGRGALTLFLEVAEPNLPARALYRRAGFSEIGRRPRYYADGAAALVLARTTLRLANQQ